MCKLIVFPIFVVSVVAKTNIEDILGTWTLVAVTPNTIPGKFCITVTLMKDSENSQCICTDGLKFELVKSLSKGVKLGEDNIGRYPVLTVDDLSIVTPSSKVTCTCGGEKNDDLAVVKKINDDYFFVYGLNTMAGNETRYGWIYARNIPTIAELTTLIKNVDKIRDKPMSLICTSD